jgi:steroid 5-alpha reductase family enzyme
MSRPTFTAHRGQSILYVLIVYLIAVPVAWWTFEASALSPPWSMAAGLLAAGLVCFAAMLPVNNGSVFDAYWSVLPPFAGLYFATLAPETGFSVRGIAVLVVTGAWAIRLTANWVRDFPGLHHEDFRYLDLYEATPFPRWAVQLFLVDLFPTLQVILGCLPLYPALMLGNPGFTALDLLAVVVGLAGTLVELVSDGQMRSFKRSRSEGANMETGLWRYSRHPNYFGEILFWISLWIFGLAAAPGFWWTGVGVVAMILMFVFASIPMMESRSRARRPGYDEYVRRTSVLIPWPPRKI